MVQINAVSVAAVCINAARIIIASPLANVNSERSSKLPYNATHIPLKIYHDAHADYQWYVPIQLGNPRQNFNVVFDTGSPQLIVPGIECKDCRTKSLYNSSASTTYQSFDNETAFYGFGTGLTADPISSSVGIYAYQGVDDFYIEGVNSGLGVFSIATKYSAALIEPDGWDGILGTSRQIWSGLNDAFGWGQDVFGLFLASAFGPTASLQSELTVGGFNPARYTGSIKYADLNADQFFWNLNVASVTSNGKKVGATNRPSVVDTGTAYIQVPDDDTTAAIYANISPAIKPIGDLGIWAAPCSIMQKLKPTVTFSLGNKTRISMTLPNSTFNLGPVTGHPSQCKGAFFGPGNTGFNGSWIIGSPLIKGYYTIWDDANSRFGVATLKI